MNIQPINYSLEDILKLDERSPRIREMKKSKSWLERFCDFFTTKKVLEVRRKTLDIKDYTEYSPLITKKMTELKNLASNPDAPDTATARDAFFADLKKMLHVSAKIKFYGWADNLKEHSSYNDFEKNLNELQILAKKHVKNWVNEKSDTLQVDKGKIQRWIEADEKQLLFSGYSNEIVYKAEEIPLGAVLLSNPIAGKAADKMQGFPIRMGRKIQGFKGILCQRFTGLPVTHSMACLGNGQFLHVDDGKDVDAANNHKPRLCSGRPVLEDHSLEKRSEAGKEGSKYMFGCEIVIPNKEAMAAQNHESVSDVDNRLNQWKDKMLEARQKAPVSSMADIIATIFRPKRPKKYSIQSVFNPSHSYSCSGLISSAMAAVGIDVDTRKKVHKVTPTDFISSPLFDIAYSNERALFEAYRKKVASKSK